MNNIFFVINFLNQTIYVNGVRFPREGTLAELKAACRLVYVYREDRDGFKQLAPVATGEFDLVDGAGRRVNTDAALQALRDADGLVHLTTHTGIE